MLGLGDEFLPVQFVAFADNGILIPLHVLAELAIQTSDQCL